jgi:hypothetical protein
LTITCADVLRRPIYKATPKRLTNESKIYISSRSMRRERSSSSECLKNEEELRSVELSICL